MSFLLKTLLPLALTASLSAQCLVCIDIGHSPKKSGAISAHGIKEYDYNKRASIELFYALSEKGIDAIFANPDEVEISLRDRTKSATTANADILVSMHHDSVKEQFLKKWSYEGKTYRYSDDFSGYGIFVSKKNPYFSKSLDAAKQIGKKLRYSGAEPTLHHMMDIKGERKKMFDKDKGVYRYDNLVVLKADIPAVLIENGVIVNREEEYRLQDDRYRAVMADNIAEGVKSWCKKEGKLN